MSKILIIGQAPPLKKQIYPYDTTLLYKILEWVDVTKEQAQELFDFEALTNEFPGLNKYKGHKIPSKVMANLHYEDVLKSKIKDSQVVILLGNAAKEFLYSGLKEYGLYENKWLFLPHPSSRNISIFRKHKELIINSLKEVLSISRLS